MVEFPVEGKDTVWLVSRQLPFSREGELSELLWLEVPFTLSFLLSSGSFFIFMESFLTVLGDLILSGKGQLIDPLFFRGLGLGGETSVEGISGLCARAAPNPSEEKRRNNHFQTAILGNEKINLELGENMLIS